MKFHLRSLFLLTIFLSLVIIFSCVKKTKLPLEDDFTNAVYRNPNFTIEQRVDDLFSKMILEEKVGQMLQIDTRFLSRKEDIAEYRLGSLLIGGQLEEPIINNPGYWANKYDRFQTQALRTRLKIPILLGVDALHGHAIVRGATIFPHNIGMGCTRNPELVKKAARITAIEVAGTGMDWNFHPCVSVARDIRWGRTYESYGETPELIRLLVPAAIKGYQGTDLKDNDTILACSKCFFAHGGTQKGIDRGNVILNEEKMRKIHLQGYIVSVENNVGSIMGSYVKYHNKMIQADKYWITDVLKEEIGFDGIFLSDWGAVDLIEGTQKEKLVKAVNAGMDMNMVPDNYPKNLYLMYELIKSKQISIDRIDDAVKRILTIKFKMGLFENPYTDRSLTKKIGIKEHREVARQCVRESVVMLKNKNNILPLSKNIKRIHVAGKNAHNIGFQCGGWTVKWQGADGNFTKGTTILEGIKEVANKKTHITYSKDGKGAKGSDLCILVIGEEPYAEYFGDAGGLRSLTLHQLDVKALEELKKANIPIITVIISGRPLMMEKYINDWDAVLAAWLPGTEGAGVADIIFGNYNPTGKLSQTWPRNLEQIPINIGDEGYDPLFPYNFGLSY